MKSMYHPRVIKISNRDEFQRQVAKLQTSTKTTKATVRNALIFFKGWRQKNISFRMCGLLY